VTVRPTRALATVLVIAVVLNLLTRVTGDAWLALGSAAAIALPLVSLVLRPALGNLSVTVKGPHSILAGTPLEQHVRITNNGRLPSPPLTWRDAVPGLDAVDVVVPGLSQGESFEATVMRGAASRGEYDGRAATLTTTAPFGVLRWVRTVPSTCHLLVHPRTDRGHALPPDGGRSGDVGSSTVAGTGIEILGLRPWRPGDPSRAVSQRATARHGRPVVLEREREQHVGPGLLVVAAGGSAGATWEQRIGYAASIALAALRDGRPVMLLSGYGGPQVARATDPTSVLDFFAAVDRAGRLDGDQVRRALRSIAPGGTCLFLRGQNAGFEAAKLGAVDVHVEVLDG
jgi:uncharacterized protein (DUF58 family)